MNKLTQSELRMQMLAGVITEGQYKAKLQENFFKNLIDKVRKKEEPIEPEKAKSELDGLTDEQALALYNEYNKQASSIDPYDPHIGDYAQVYQTLASKLKTMYPNAIKESLNEHMVGGIVGVGAINQIPATPKTDYEMAFEHFLGEKYEIKEEMGENIADFLNQNMDEVKEKLGDVFSGFEIIGDPKVATAGEGEEGIDVSFDKEYMLELFPEGDPYNEVESIDIAGKTVYYNDYR